MGKKIIIGSIVIILILFSILIPAGIIKFNAILPNGNNKSEEIQPLTNKEFLIFMNESNVYAQNLDNGDIIDSNKNATIVIQNAINQLIEGGKITLKGNFTKTQIKPITILSNTKVIINGSIKLATDIGDGAIVFANEDSENGNDNITIIGGIIDGNRENQTYGQQIAIKLTKVSNCLVNATIINFRGENIRETDLGTGNTFVNNLYPNIKSLQFDTQDILHNHSNWRLLTDFENDSEWDNPGGTGTVSLSNIRFSGNKSLKITSNGGSCYVRTVDEKFKFDPRTNRFRAKIRVNDVNVLGSLNRILFMTDKNNFYKFKIDLSPIINNNSWEEILFDRWITEGNPNPENITQVWFQFNSVKGKNFSVYIDTLEVLSPIFKKGVITLTFDDNTKSHYTKIFPLMKEFGYAGVEGYSHRFTEMNETQIKKLQAEGWDIVNHGWSHKSQKNYTKAEIEEDILLMANYMKNKGFDGYNYYIAPGGYLVYYDLMEKFNIFSRGLGSGHQTIPPTSCFITAFSVISNTTISSLINKIDDAIERGEWLILLFHGLDGNGYQPWTSDNFSALLNYISEKDLTVITFTEAWKTITNMTSQRDK